MTNTFQKTADFDKAAPLYDDTFTESQIGQLQRRRVYYWLDQNDFFNTISSVFELNCGTGYDADYFHKKGINVIATDGSSKMIEVAKAKRNPKIKFLKMEFQEISDYYSDSEVVFSNFGGLNCLDSEELLRLVQKTSQLQKPGDLWIGVIMPRFCLMESFYFLSKLKLKKAFRRNTSQEVAVNVNGTAVSTYYHSPKTVKKMLRKDYILEKIKPISVFLPPSYLEPFFAKRKKTLRFLNRMESFFGKISCLSGLSDHFILIARKK